jgi:hypothetical protein
MCTRRRWRRREYVAGLAAAVTGLSGCTAGAGDSSGSMGMGASDPPPCAEGFRIAERDATIGKGTVPEVRLALRNDGSESVAYDIKVIFRQGTSLGIETRTGRDTLAGTVPAGETVVATATDDSLDIRNTTEYVLGVSLSCPE